MSRTTKRLSAAVAAVALGATALMGVAVSAASAAPANIDPNQSRSLTIHNLTAPAVPGPAGDGAEVPEADLPSGTLPLKNVEFTVQQVTAIGGTPVDLATDAGWVLIEPYLSGTTPFTPAGNTLVQSGKASTDQNGQVAFTSLPVGLFYVTQTSAGGNPISSSAQPFLVTLPMPTSEPGVFRYDVHAYPKSMLTAGFTTKTIDDSAAHAVGDLVTWKVSAQFPNTPGYELEEFGMMEMPDTSYLDWENGPQGVDHPCAPLAAVPGDCGAFAGVSVTHRDGSTVQLEAADLVWDPLGNPNAIVLTPSGIDRVNVAAPGAILEFSVEMRVRAVPANGKVSNGADFYFNGSPANPVVYAESSWGTAQFTKHAAGDVSKVLAGAEFRVFAAKADADAAATKVAAGQPVTDGLVFETGTWNAGDNRWENLQQAQAFTTDDTGVVTIPGLKASQAGVKYWAVETKAPAGYVASTTPIEFTVTPGDTPTGAAAVNVPNQMRQAGALPVLGGAGMAAIGIGGAILIAGGVLFAIFGRRKHDTAEA